MINQSLKRFCRSMYCTKIRTQVQDSRRRFVNGVFSRFSSDKAEKEGVNQPQKLEGVPSDYIWSAKFEKDPSSREDVSDSKWSLELAWLPKALEPALQLCKRVLATGSEVASKPPPSTRSVSEIIASIQRSKIGIEGWSLSDLTVGLYLIYLRQASLNPFEDVNGIRVTSDSIVHDLIYHLELAKGCYRDNASAIARTTMLRESNIMKFVKSSSFMRPGYYMGVDPRKKLVILAIRGTQSIYDLITDIISSSDEEVTFEGYSTHFGTAEAARWFLTHEIGTIRKCLEKHKGFRLRLVGHSLGGAIASLLAVMLRKKSQKELGFSPDLVSAVGYATPPCVSKELAEHCSDYVKTVVMQDDIVPRLSAASIARLRNEIIQTDWMSVVEKEDWKSMFDLFANAKQVVSSVQNVARKLADFAQIGDSKNSTGITRREPKAPAAAICTVPVDTKVVRRQSDEVLGAAGKKPEELFVPGTVYYLKRNVEVEESDDDNGGRGRGSEEAFSLWRRNPGEHFQRIVLTSNIISDHKCDSHFYALRDVLKSLPWPYDEHIFR